MDDFEEKEMFEVDVWSSRFNFLSYDFEREVQDNIFEEEENFLENGVIELE